MVRRKAKVVALALSAPTVATAQSLPRVTLSGDVRLRMEEEWDSRTAAGVPRPIAAGRASASAWVVFRP